MTATRSRSTLYLTLAAVMALSVMTTARAFAGDTGKILGALAAGYLAYEVLDGLDDCSRSRRSHAPAPRYRAPSYPHQNYNPPNSYYQGGEAKYWYKEGYQDGFTDGDRYGTQKGFNQGYRVGYHDGDKNGHRRGVRKGYRIGFGDGYDVGHYDGYVTGRHHGRRW